MKREVEEEDWEPSLQEQAEEIRMEAGDLHAFLEEEKQQVDPDSQRKEDWERKEDPEEEVEDPKEEREDAFEDDL